MPGFENKSRAPIGVTRITNTRSGQSMAADDKTSKPKEKALKEPKEKTSSEPKEKAPAEAKPDATAEAPKNYSRGEGQKAVTQAYKDNWNAIYGKKKKR
jgi:hypothetical protein